MYEGSTDWTQARDLSAGNPEKLRELQRLFLIEATRYNVLPLDDRSFERVLPEISKKPTLIGNRQLLFPGMGGMTEQHVVNWRNRSWSVNARITLPENGADGVILNLGGHGGGCSIYLKDSIPTFCYNLFGIDPFYVRGKQPVSPGQHDIRMDFGYDGGGLGKGGEVTLSVDGQTTATGRIERIEPIAFGYEYTEIGRDALSPVTDDYSPGYNTFTGTIDFIEIEAGDDSHDHLIDPADFFRVAMWKQ